MVHADQTKSGPQQYQQRPMAIEAVSGPGREPTGVSRHNALIIGDIDPAIWDHQVRLTTGRSQNGIQSMRWVTPIATEPFGTFADRMLFRNLVGMKDEAAVLPGRIDGVKRGNNSAVENSIAWIDLDQGIFWQELYKTILASGYLAIVWGTYNHMKPATKVKSKALRETYGDGARIEQAGWNVFRDVKGVRPEFLEGATVKPDDDGNAVVHHKQLPRWRVGFLLKHTIVLRGFSPRFWRCRQRRP